MSPRVGRVPQGPRRTVSPNLRRTRRQKGRSDSGGLIFGPGLAAVLAGQIDDLI